MADLKLSYGATRSLPEGVRAAWGARLIWPNDLVWDRQDIAGEEGDRAELATWVNGSRGLESIRPLAQALERAAQLARLYELDPGADRTVVLYEDERGTIVGNPQGSHGYLYVAAWLKAHA